MKVEQKIVKWLSENPDLPNTAWRMSRWLNVHSASMSSQLKKMVDGGRLLRVKIPPTQGWVYKLP